MTRFVGELELAARGDPGCHYGPGNERGPAGAGGGRTAAFTRRLSTTDRGPSNTVNHPRR